MISWIEPLKRFYKHQKNNLNVKGFLNGITDSKVQAMYGKSNSFLLEEDM